MKKLNTCSYGFTLIEMVVVILVLSILAATAVARIADTSTQTRLASLKSFKGTLFSVANMAKGMCLSDVQCNIDETNGNTSTTIDGHRIYFHYGYPVGWLGGTDADGAGSLQQLIDSGKFRIDAGQSSTTQAVYLMEGAPDHTQCKLIYSLAPSNNAAVLSIQTITSGC
ncbi:pilus assembly FimT family protein [Methylophilus aquaticus]|uniref:Type II secretion system protein n=1 Tax=Methylophilus aquaticus TaxID=1971610 RepID=A0ABT9JV31_9PROT|nr:type II secretion system protein [Methylophilus aquaticus]MDP8568417.1 type II secretion system protein [Methylophilus aquaticus]